jgi:hypothetical protein
MEPHLKIFGADLALGQSTLEWVWVKDILKSIKCYEVVK